MKILLLKGYASIPNIAIDFPIGLLYLSAYLKKYLNDKIQIKFIDLRFKKKISYLNKSLKEFKPDIIGISMLAYEYPLLDDYCKAIKAYNSKASIITGGPYATYNYEDILTRYPVDMVVIGEGEKTFLNIIVNKLNNKDCFNIKGIAYYNGKKVICNERQNYIENINEIPVPDYSIVDLKSYWSCKHNQMNFLLANKNYMPIISSRACPFNCCYCHNIFGKKFRPRSPENFFEEIKLLYYKYNVREFHIIDDIFNLDRKRMYDILNLIINSNMKIKLAFPNALRGDLLNHEDILLLKKAGAYMITVSVESASERVQKQINKNLNIKKIASNIEYASQIGLITKGYFMIGFPGESIKEIKKTIRFALNSKLDMASFFVVVPYKGTVLWDLVCKIKPDFKYNIFTSFWDKKTLYQELTGYNLNKLQIKAYMRFYTPKRLLRLFSKIKLPLYTAKRFFITGIKLSFNLC